MRAGRDRRGYTAVNLLADLVVPLGLYYGLRAAGLGIYLTLLVAAAVPTVFAAYRLLCGQRVDGLAVYMVTTMALGTGVSLITGSTQLLLAKEGWLTGITALWFLVSVRADRPLSFLFTRPMLEGWGPIPRESWDTMWEQLPRFRQIWRTSSIMWGLGLLIDSAIRVAMAYILPADQVPALGTALYAGTSLVLIVVTNIYYFFAGLYDRLSPMYAKLATTPAQLNNLVIEAPKP